MQPTQLCNTCHTPNNTPLLIPEPQNSKNGHFYTHTPGNYDDLCILPDVELLEGYKPPKLEVFDSTGDPRVHLRTYCDKLVGVGKDERISRKLFIRSLKGDALSWYISQDPKKWSC